MTGDEFFLLFALTILVTRVLLYVRPTSSPTIAGFRLHHYMYGVVMSVVSLLIGSLALFAIGLALFVDELTWLLMRGKDHKDNYSWLSLGGTAVFTLTVFLLRDFLVMPFT